MRSAATSIIDDCLATFVHGFCLTRSRTHPYLAERVDGLWRMADAPGRRRSDYRREEWVAFNRPPRDVDRIARAQARGRFVICAIRDLNMPLDELRDGYKSIGYRLSGTEPLFIHRLERIPRRTSPADIRRVLTDEWSVALGKASKMRPRPAAEYRDGGPVRQYVATVNEKIIGFVSSIAAGERRWCSNLFVSSSHRRKGIGGALMSRMLRDDRTHGAQATVLLASHSGAKLYATLGFEQVGELLLLTPKRS